MMAKRRSKSRKGFVTIPFRAAISLGALDVAIVIKDDLFGNPFGEDIYVLSIDAVWTLEDHTARDASLTVGFCHDDLATAEVEECLTAELTDPDDIIQKERARRPVRMAGKFNGLLTEETLNDGKFIRTPMRMSIGNDHDIGVWAQNTSQTIWTSGSRLKIEGRVYGRWQR